MKKVIFMSVILFAFAFVFTSCDDAVAPDPGSNGNITPSTNPGKIVYGVKESGTWKIYVMDKDGSSKAAVTDAGGSHVMGIGWSPGNDWIVFSSDASGVYELYKVKTNSTLFTQITFDGATGFGVGNIQPSWANSNELLYTTCRVGPGQREIARMNSDGSGMKILTNQHVVMFSYQYPCIVESNWVTFSKGDPGNPASSSIWVGEYCCFGNQVQIADVGGSNSGDFYPDYLSNKIVFSNEGGCIYSVNLDGSNLQNISLVSGVIDREPHFSPDGSQVAFISNQSGVNNIWVMNIDGSNRNQLTNINQPNSIESLDWR